MAAQQRCLSKGILAWPSHHCGPRPGATQNSLGSSSGAHPETWPSPHHFSQCPSGPARRPPAAQPHSGVPSVSTRSASSPRADPGPTRPHCFRGASQAAPATPKCLLCSPFPWLSRNGRVLFSRDEEHLLPGGDSLEVPVAPALPSSTVQRVSKFPLSGLYPCPHPKALSNSMKSYTFQCPPPLQYSSRSPIVPH